MSTYPDRCTLHLERRTVVGESETVALDEVEEILSTLKKEDEEFEAVAKLLFDRRPYETPIEDDLPRELESATSRLGLATRREGMTFWTDAAVLGAAGIPSVIFGPGGEGLHSIEEYVRADEVLFCRDALVELARAYCG
jgi:acetylornithine deacetylase